MPTSISDGKGTGSLAKVTDGRIQVESNDRPFISFKAKAESKAFSITSIVTSGIAADAYIMSIKNIDSSGGFVVSRINIASDQAVSVRAHRVTGTPSGTTLTPRQLNFGSDLPAQLSCNGDGAVTGLSSDYFFAELSVAANIPAIIDTAEVPIITAGSILGLQISSIPGTDPSRIAVTVFGYESNLET